MWPIDKASQDVERDKLTTFPLRKKQNTKAEPLALQSVCDDTRRVGVQNISEGNTVGDRARPQIWHGLTQTAQ